ncbi:MAG TPA: hypothetical protein VH120_12900, partial [Gemmataceae bacterium]|nr:hypothetical protein [Gemmataceae bacterium]
MLLGYGRRIRRQDLDAPATTADAAWFGRRLSRLAREAAQVGLLPAYELVVSTTNLLRVFDRLGRHGGPAPGPDDLTYADLSRPDAANLLRKVSQAILAGTYRPGPDRLVGIPK